MCWSKKRRPCLEEEPLSGGLGEGEHGILVGVFDESGRTEPRVICELILDGENKYIDKVIE